MQNEIYDEKNGLTYMLCGDYYLPELALTDIEPTYGKYGMLRKSYLQEHRKAKYQILLLQGKLVEHLNHIDAEARDREEQLVKLMMEKQGITEKLKRQDNMEWTRRMNTLCHDAEEMESARECGRMIIIGMAFGAIPDFIPFLGKSLETLVAKLLSMTNE